MSKLINLLKMSAVATGTGLATWKGMDWGVDLSEHLPQAYLVPPAVQGITAFFTGVTGNKIARRVIHGKRRNISSDEAYSISALNAFANAKNDSRELSVAESLQNISDNLVEVVVSTGGNKHEGSGLLMTTDGYVLTAHHVVEDFLKNGEGGVEVHVPGKWLPLVVERENIYCNSATDIAILKSNKYTMSARPIKVKVDQDCCLKRGDEVRVLGFRDGQKYNTLGLITDPNRTWHRKEGVVYDLFETDARGKQGQSGGVIANGKGELIGVTVYSSRRNGEEIGVIGGAKISNALNYINQIAAEKSSKMFHGF